MGLTHLRASRPALPKQIDRYALDVRLHCGYSIDMNIDIGTRVTLTRSYTRGRDMEQFVAGERGVVSGFDGADTALVRMDQDDFVYPIPTRILRASEWR